MEQNPYQSPVESSSSVAAKKRNLAAQLTGMGMILIVLGVLLIVSFIVLFERVGDGPKYNSLQNGLQVVAMVGMALVPIGIMTAVIGGVVWVFIKLRQRR